MVLLPEPSAERAFELAEKIRIRFSEMDRFRSGKHTVSCGVTVSRPDETSDDTCSRVDHGLYSAKEQGKNRTVIL